MSIARPQAASAALAPYAALAPPQVNDTIGQWAPSANRGGPACRTGLGPRSTTRWTERRRRCLNASAHATRRHGVGSVCTQLPSFTHAVWVPAR
eukprot:499877-Pleurochrysis_carterae.AAC.2